MILALLLACRPLPGEHDYASQEDLSWLTDDAVLGGDVPWSPGDPRLSVGLFYEGGSSHLIPVDNLGVFYYIYEGTFFQDTSPERTEGALSERIVHGGGDWWGGGVHFEDGARDFTPWATLHLSVRADDASFEATRVGITTVDGQFETPLTDHGFVADGAWHTLEIDLTTVAAGLDHTESPLLLLGGPGPAGAELLVDDLYWVP